MIDCLSVSICLMRLSNQFWLLCVYTPKMPSNLRTHLISNYHGNGWNTDIQTFDLKKTHSYTHAEICFHLTRIRIRIPHATIPICLSFRLNLVPCLEWCLRMKFETLTFFSVIKQYTLCQLTCNIYLIISRYRNALMVYDDNLVFYLLAKNNRTHLLGLRPLIDMNGAIIFFFTWMELFIRIISIGIWFLEVDCHQATNSKKEIKKKSKKILYIYKIGWKFWKWWNGNIRTDEILND